MPPLLLPRVRDRACRPHDLRSLCQTASALHGQQRVVAFDLGSLVRGRILIFLVVFLLSRVWIGTHPCQLSRRPAVRRESTAIDGLEEAVSLLRSASSATIATYLVGAVPFL